MTPPTNPAAIEVKTRRELGGDEDDALYQWPAAQREAGDQACPDLLPPGGMGCL